MGGYDRGGYDHGGNDRGGRGDYDRRGGYNRGDDRGKGDSRGGGRDSGRSGTKLYVANLPDDIDQEAMDYVFRNYGPVADIHIMTGRSSSGQACAFVRYEHEGSASKCMT